MNAPRPGPLELMTRQILRVPAADTHDFRDTGNPMQKNYPAREVVELNSRGGILKQGD